LISLLVLSLAPLPALHAAGATTSQEIDRETLDKWSAPYRDWHYQPGHVSPAQPNIPDHADFKNTDVPTIYQLPNQPDKWVMSYIAFNGKGYNSFVAESTNLVEWTNPRLAMGFGKPGEFDFGGCVIGAFLYESYDIKAGGNPSGLDKQFAHKISLVYNPKNETFYLYNCATGNKGRGIGLITSKPLQSGATSR
jgi:hypothetical protein